MSEFKKGDVVHVRGFAGKFEVNGKPDDTGYLYVRELGSDVPGFISHVRALTRLAPAPAATPDTGFKKFDDGKAPLALLALLPQGPAVEIAKCLEYGGVRYGFRNYEKGAAWSRYLSATLRHLFAWAWREESDKESGLPHLAHAGANILILLALQQSKKGTDDRIKVTP